MRWFWGHAANLPAIVPSREEFLAADGQRGLLWLDLQADTETPLSAYWKLSQDETYSYLLESVTGGEKLARYSMIGVRPSALLRSRGGTNVRLDLKTGNREESRDTDIFEFLRREHQARRLNSVSGMPKFVGGLVGCLAYDIVKHIEKLPETTTDDLHFDDLVMMATDATVVFDHAKNLLRVLVSADRTAAAYDRSCQEIERIAARLKAPLPELPQERFSSGDVWSNMEQAEFEAAVRKGIEYITAGDCFQVVLSQRFSTSAPAHPVSYYRALRTLNPSPYMFLMRFGDFDVVGASPEILVSLEDRTARVRPIAGTRPRSQDPAEDDRLAAELLADEKERAEHVMLIDLGRNDLGRVCEYGTVQVNDLMQIERYSHVMHIVSDVVGTLRPELDAMDLVKACFPAGTVSGAPKVRAMEIIDELEPTRRGLYAGAAGYWGDDGHLDLCIAIRTILLTHGEAHVQAGAGVVYDSDPEREYLETCNKAAACLGAILAGNGSD